MVPENARLDYIEDDAEVPRRCAHFISTDGSRIAGNDALETAIALSRVLLCERYMKQLQYMREAARRFPEHAGEASGLALSPEARFRLKDVLNNQ